MTKHAEMPCGLSTKKQVPCKGGELIVIIFLLFLLLLVADHVLLGLLGGNFTVVFRLPLAGSLGLLQGEEEG